jgi:hypothetical protein
LENRRKRRLSYEDNVKMDIIKRCSNVDWIKLINLRIILGLTRTDVTDKQIKFYFEETDKFFPSNLR